MNIKKIMTGSAIGVGSVLATAVAVFAATVIISPTNAQGWTFAQETPTGSGAFVNGPGTPPLGDGSANLIVDGTGGEILATADSDYLGVRLDDITNLEYSTYRTLGAPALAAALQFNIDSDLTDANNAYQGRLVYEPYYTQTVNTGVWQTWDPQSNLGTGNWWFSNGTLATTSGCTQANPCTWAEVLGVFPNAGIHSTFGALIFKAGSNWTGGFNGNVDAFTIGVNDVDTTYDFELTAPTPTPSPTPGIRPPTSKDACKKDGYKTLTDFNGNDFRNQGQCVSYFNHQ